jgi:transcriptional regulator with XRE-family HTH domain
MKKNQEEMFSEKIISNIRKIMRDRGLPQVTMAEYAGTSESQFSKILNGKVQLSLWQLENLASKLSMREIDIVTYPKVYIEREQAAEEPVEAVLQIKLKKDKKDQVLKLVFGDNNIEILNK